MQPPIRTVLKIAKQVLYTGLILAILYYSGLLGTVSSYSQQVILQTSILDASPGSQSKEVFPLDFELQRLDGSIVSMSSLKDKVIFLNIWATWCGPCRAEMANIQKLHASMANKGVEFVMLAVDNQGEEEKIKTYLANKNFTFPVYRPMFNTARPLPQALDVRSIPTTFVIDKKGTIAYEHAGMANYNTKKFQNFIVELTQQH